MKTVWFKGSQTTRERDERRMQVLAGSKAFEILTGILADKIAEKESERNRPKNYELPSYACYQADISGYIRAIDEVRSIIDITKE